MKSTCQSDFAINVQLSFQLIFCNFCFSCALSSGENQIVFPQSIFVWSRRCLVSNDWMYFFCTTRFILNCFFFFSIYSNIFWKKWSRNAFGVDYLSLARRLVLLFCWGVLFRYINDKYQSKCYDICWMHFRVKRKERRSERDGKWDKMDIQKNATMLNERKSFLTRNTGEEYVQNDE